MAAIAAQQETDRAFEIAQVIAESAQRSTVAAVARLTAQAERAFAATEGELEAGKEAAEQEVDFLTKKKNQILVYRGEEKYAADKSAESLLATAEPTFAGLFYDKTCEFFADYVQDRLRCVATVAAFFPGLGWLVSGVAGAADGAISYYRGDRVGGLIEIGLSVIPVFGRFGKLARTITGTGGRVGGALGHGGVSSMMAAAPLGRLGGRLFGEASLDALEKYLAKRGVTLIRNADLYLAKQGAHGSFEVFKMERLECISNLIRLFMR